MQVNAQEGGDMAKQLKVKRLILLAWCAALFVLLMCSDVMRYCCHLIYREKKLVGWV